MNFQVLHELSNFRSDFAIGSGAAFLLHCLLMRFRMVSSSHSAATVSDSVVKGWQCLAATRFSTKNLKNFHGPNRAETSLLRRQMTLPGA